MSRAFAIGDSSGPGEARRAAVALAGRLGFAETERGEIALIVTEAATNLTRHAGGGTLILRPFPPGGLHDAESGLEILVLDRGAGMPDVDRCRVDGYSTVGGAGKGLGAIARLADRLEIHSDPGRGTALLARVYLGPPPPASGAGAETVQVGAVHLPMPGETVCGDAWAVDERPDRRRLLVADGLGHGQFAAEASGEAVRVFRERADLPLEDLVHALHAALRGTRGAALAIAEQDLSRDAGPGEPGELRYVGVGNVSGQLFDPADGSGRSLLSHNGTVGAKLLRVQRVVLPWPAGGLLVMHSDGLATGWRLADHRGLVTRHPGLIAGLLYRDFVRGRDDATVVALRPHAGEPDR
ncbi:ATP-binding SpoIIE family protein phosphatase [Alienimonas californiensis]|uniref:ATP-binding SpoIIE family protein phosphatase n=1 Tax=Alienimonas californiensis TaxID=2527989 RepID=UPI001A98DAE4|nr:ATP-binding SpoIIE family protein phosphatase [Alienimonas californiensis]